MRILGIDPGYTQTAWVDYDAVQRKLMGFGIEPNAVFLDTCANATSLVGLDLVAIEKVEGFGMAVGKEVFETVWWTGRFHQELSAVLEPVRITRRAVKLHLCGSSRAKDANIRQSLLDRFGPGKDAAIGTRSKPGPLYGVSKDVWAALAVAVTVAEAGVPAEVAA